MKPQTKHYNHAEFIADLEDRRGSDVDRYIELSNSLVAVFTSEQGDFVDLSYLGETFNHAGVTDWYIDTKTCTLHGPAYDQRFEILIPHAVYVQYATATDDFDYDVDALIDWCESEGVENVDFDDYDVNLKADGKHYLCYTTESTLYKSDLANVYEYGANRYFSPENCLFDCDCTSDNVQYFDIDAAIANFKRYYAFDVTWTMVSVICTLYSNGTEITASALGGVEQEFYLSFNNDYVKDIQADLLAECKATYNQALQDKINTLYKQLDALIADKLPDAIDATNALINATPAPLDEK